MRRLCIGVFLVAMSTLALELLLTRVFDVILTSNLAYFIVTSAVFAIGLAGIYTSLRPIPSGDAVRPLLTKLAIGFAVWSALLVPIINALPFAPDDKLTKEPVSQVLYFIGIYLTLLIPFFLAGYILIAVFSTYARRIQTLYFWDLVGAGIGCALIVPVIPMVGPGGLTLVIAGVGLIAAALFATSRKVAGACVAAAVVIAAVPFIYMPNYIDFTNYEDHRGIVEDKALGRLEITKWDPISKIDVLDKPYTPAEYEKSWRWWTGGDRKHIAYDGGSQSSFFYKFDGDLTKLRKDIEADRMFARQQFWQISVPLANYLKRDTGHEVLVIGAAGGHDTKGALMYGASHVDSIELVGAVLALGKGKYAAYTGNFFNNPKADIRQGEGRSFLRASHKKYDVIQIHSNHTSSSIAAGNGAIAPVYLQTVQAYREYFTHLKDDGILQINHHMYPRMITTAAVAWKQLGFKDFKKHVVIFTTPVEHNLPTVLFKMTPWTQTELDAIDGFLNQPGIDPFYGYKFEEHPLDVSKSFLPEVFYSGDLPKDITDKMSVDVTPVTDDNPYFNLLRKRIEVLQPDPEHYVSAAMVQIPNDQMKKGNVPMDMIHLIGISIVSVVFVTLFVFLPLRFSTIGRAEGTKPWPLLVYFSCLGLGFIVIELTFIQKFMQLIGSPLYTYSTVIFVLLLASGLGSLLSEKIVPTESGRWRIPFFAIIAMVILFALVEKTMFNFGLQFDLPGRIAVAAVLLFPVGFFLGMPFPLGVLAIESRPKGAIAWAWGMNGAFTIVGGALSVVLSVKFGFTVTLLVSMLIYALAALVFPRLAVAPVQAHKADLAPQAIG